MRALAGSRAGEDPLARRANYGFEKRQRELRKKKKKEEKAARKREEADLSDDATQDDRNEDTSGSNDPDRD